ncbi:MAG: hypothetical protein RSB96_02575 [Oscillospiraceae bacterium]
MTICNHDIWDTPSSHCRQWGDTDCFSGGCCLCCPPCSSQQQYPPCPPTPPSPDPQLCNLDPVIDMLIGENYELQEIKEEIRIIQSGIAYIISRLECGIHPIINKGTTVDYDIR